MLAGVTMVKDEADIIGYTLDRQLEHLDLVIAADNGSTDGTREILESRDAVIVLDDDEVAYYQGAKMTALAEAAVELGAEWIVPFDADELWLGLNRLRNLERDNPAIRVASARLFDHVATARDPEAAANPLARIGHRRREMAPLRKVAFRPRGADFSIHQGNHGVDLRDTAVAPTAAELLEIRHYPYRSPEQFIRKVRNGAAAYAAARKLPRDAGQHWRDYGRTLEAGGERALEQHFNRWFYAGDPEADDTLTFDPAPGEWPSG